MNNFEELGLSSNVLEAINALNYQTPSKIQTELIPLIIDGYDCIGQAQTGTGKTLAFAASILSKLNKEGNNTKCIILTPTRELAIQIAKEFNILDINNQFKTFAVYGGDSIDRQIKTLKNGVDIVVGTPGRVQDLIKRRKLNLTTINYFVLDEADEMLNMGFIEDIENILDKTSRDKQVLMLSATMPKKIKDLAKNYMKKDLKHIVIESTTRTSDNIKASFYLVNDKHRLEILCRILDSKKLSKSIIFARTKIECDSLVSELQERGYLAETMHGDISQILREKTLERFKRGTFNHLIATDVAARGIHVDNIDLVINYRLPENTESYIHRIGRTGRAQNQGEAISLISYKERKEIEKIAKETNSTIKEMPIPESQDIIKNKYLELLDKVNELITEKNHEEAIEYVRDLNKGDLINLSAALLKYTATKEIGSNINKTIEIKERLVSRLDNDKTRVFVNIGKKDGLKKGSLLDFIKETTKMDKAFFTNIEVLSTFTFIDIKANEVNKFIDLFTNQVYKGRKINVEISKNKATKNTKKSNFKKRSSRR